MNVGVIGSGDVAQVLAGGFMRHGHSVMMGTRTPGILGFLRNDWSHAFKLLA